MSPTSHLDPSRSRVSEQLYSPQVGKSPLLDGEEVEHAVRDGYHVHECLVLDPALGIGSPVSFQENPGVLHVEAFQVTQRRTSVPRRLSQLVAEYQVKNVSV